MNAPTSITEFQSPAALADTRDNNPVTEDLTDIRQGLNRLFAIGKRVTLHIGNYGAVQSPEQCMESIGRLSGIEREQYMVHVRQALRSVISAQ